MLGIVCNGSQFMFKPTVHKVLTGGVTLSILEPHLTPGSLPNPPYREYLSPIHLGPTRRHTFLPPWLTQRALNPENCKSRVLCCFPKMHESCSRFNDCSMSARPSWLNASFCNWLHTPQLTICLHNLPWYTTYIIEVTNIGFLVKPGTAGSVVATQSLAELGTSIIADQGH